MNINGTNIILTGASSGIGKELLERLREFDCTIVATSRSIEEATGKTDAGRTKVEKGDAAPPDGKNVYYKNFDLSKKGEIDELFDYALEKMGSIDLFIANAGFMYYEKIYPADYDHIQEIFRLNTTGVMYSAVKMKEVCKERPYNFVAVSSALGFISYPGYALYCSTKAALRGFGQGYRYELSPDQHYQSVYPIAVKTGFFDKAHCDDPPKPQQSTEHVAKTIIRGIEKNKSEIHTSKSFWFFKTFMPYMLNLVIWLEKKKFDKKFS